MPPPIWSNSTITRYKERGEDEFVSAYPCIIARVAPAIVSGASVYTLADAVLNIRRVTWKGKKLNPISLRVFRECGYSEDALGIPREYVFSHTGTNEIRLHPTPNENIAGTSSGLYTTAIATNLVIEYWSAADHSALVIPACIRQRLLKVYVLKQLFKLEGKGKSLKNAKFFSDLWDQLSAEYANILYELNEKPRKLINGGPSTYPPSGRGPLLLPSDFGIGVDPGY
jgi:hypothetical protein